MKRRGAVLGALPSLVFRHHRGRTAAPIADLLAVRPGPLAHRRGVSALLRDPCLGRPAGCLAGMLDVPDQRASQSPWVLAWEVDLVWGPVHRRSHGLLGRAAVDVVLEDDLYPLPSRPPWPGCRKRKGKWSRTRRRLAVQQPRVWAPGRIRRAEHRLSDPARGADLAEVAFFFLSRMAISSRRDQTRRVQSLGDAGTSISSCSARVTRLCPARLAFLGQLEVLHRHSDRVPVADAIAVVDSLPNSAVISPRRWSSCSCRDCWGNCRNEPGMAAEGDISGAIDV